jgi:hypothetical protein
MCSYVPYDEVQAPNINKRTRNISRRRQLLAAQQQEQEQREYLLTTSYDGVKLKSCDISQNQARNKNISGLGTQISSKSCKARKNTQEDEKERSFRLRNSSVNDEQGLYNTPCNTSTTCNWLQEERLSRDVSLSLVDGKGSLTSSISDLEYSNNELFADSAKYIRPANNAPWWQKSLPACVNEPRDSCSHHQLINRHLLTESLNQCNYPNRNSVFTQINHVLPFIHNGHRICDIFWKSSLTFHSYKTGDKLVDFRSLWSKESELRSILQESYYDLGLRRLLVDLSLLVIHCGPLRVLKVMVELQLIG